MNSLISCLSACPEVSLERDAQGRIIAKHIDMGYSDIMYEYQYDDMGRIVRVLLDKELVEAYEYGPSGLREREYNVLRGIKRNYQAVEKVQSASSEKKSRPLMYVQYTARPGFFLFLASHTF